MREIKFRVWHPKSKYFSYWGFIENDKEIFAGIPSSNEPEFTMDYVRKNSQQFTGLRDKNGVEIYEGDVVECDYREISTRKRFPLRGCVEWDNASCCYICKSDNEKEDFVLGVILGDPRDPVEIFTVIGNIHENADLLKERTEGE